MSPNDPGPRTAKRRQAEAEGRRPIGFPRRTPATDTTHDGHAPSAGRAPEDKRERHSDTADKSDGTHSGHPSDQANPERPEPPAPVPLPNAPTPLRGTRAAPASSAASRRAVAADVVTLATTEPTQLINFHVDRAMRQHIVALVAQLKQQGVRTSQSELFNALLAHAPANADGARALLRAYRTRRDELL